jgi:D-alanyl-lipoteichoic acid acyltransferase DltB (MBOAT superfamily)
MLVASYYFYACWDWRFLFLLIFSTLLDFYTGLKISENNNPAKKKYWLLLSIAINLGFLGFFKYYNFFISSFADLLAGVGLHIDPWTLQVILPVGISFYTFHGLSYVLDVYRGRIPTEKNIIDYSLFVSFFPLLVAGPIERATHLLPQIKTKRTFEYSKAVDGLRQILWGLFKKIVIADNCAGFVNEIFTNASHYNGSTLVLGAILFAFQIYCDFSGYSDIALGTARLFGFDLLRNFAYPYFSRDIAEFWRRWHISLSSWFRDYLYIPLGGSKGGAWMTIRNTLIIFIVSGFWHGANWTFIVWGLLNALYILPSMLLKTHRDHLDIAARGRLLPTFKELVSICLTFALTTFAWIFFRAENLTNALSYLSRICSKSLFKKPDGVAFAVSRGATIFELLGFILPIFLIVEWLGRERQYAIQNIAMSRAGIRWAAYIFLLVLISIFYYNEIATQFIYFQF